MENISQDFANNPQEETVYRALRDSVLQLHNFVSETARKTNHSYLVDISWDIRDHSLINWISFSRCFLIREGNKIQFLSKPRFLENISIELHKGDKILICSDSLIENHSDVELDELVKSCENVDDACQKLLQLSNDAYGNPTEVNLVVMEVREPSVNAINAIDIDNTSKAVSNQTGTTTLKTKPTSSSGSWWLVPLILAFAGLAYWAYKNNLLGNLSSFNKTGSDSSNLQDTVYFFKKDTANQQKIEASTTPQAPIKSDSSNGFNIQAKVAESKVPKAIEEKPKATETAKWEEPKKTETKPAISTTKSANNNNGGVSKSSGKEKEALLGQQARWKKIKEDLQAEANAGRNVEEELKNANEVLQRIEKKLNKAN